MLHPAGTEQLRHIPLAASLLRGHFFHHPAGLRDQPVEGLSALKHPAPTAPGAGSQGRGYLAPPPPL